jgi:hypothetical protein
MMLSLPCRQKNHSDCEINVKREIDPFISQVVCECPCHEDDSGGSGVREPRRPRKPDKSMGETVEVEYI